MKRILIVDDEIEMLDSLRKLFSHKPDFKVTVINEPYYAKTVIQQEVFDLLITDLKMKNFSGIDLLKLSKKYHPDCPVILISGYGTIETSVEAMRNGASDFLEKPFTSSKLFECIDKAITRKKGKQSIPINENKKIGGLTGLIYNSEKMKKIVDSIQTILPGDTNILITGESGTGKEVLARTIHQLTKSSTDPFVPVKCGDLPESLFESELFGYERGAFTGAERSKPGLLEFANHGTIFFDEIGEISLALQKKLLSIIEEKKIQRVGGTELIHADVRLIAASNKNLQKFVSDGIFSDELYKRLKTISIDMPPLRERIEDILPLANLFLQEVCREKGDTEKKFSVEVEELLESYSWPGNIRELHNIVNRAYLLNSGSVISKNDLPIPLHNHNELIPGQVIDKVYSNAKEKILENFEVEYLTHHLRNNSGNVSKTAEQCGMDRRTIHRLIKKYGIIYKETGEQ